MKYGQAPSKEVIQESVGILYGVLMSNAVLNLLGLILYFSFSDRVYDEKLQLLTMPGFADFFFLVGLMYLKQARLSVRIKTNAMMWMSYFLYLFSIGFYFHRDIAPMAILLGLLYMFISQILLSYKFALLFASTGVLASVALYYIRFEERLGIGIGFTLTLCFFFGVALYAVGRYIHLLEDFKEKMETQLEALYESETRNELIHRASNELIWDFDLETGIRSFPDGILNNFGDRLSESSDIEDWMDDIHPEDAPELLRSFNEMKAGRLDHFELSFRQINAIGEAIWYSAKVICNKDRLGKVNRMVGSYTLIHDRKQKELEIEFLAYYDKLTELPNRSAFIKKFDEGAEWRVQENAFLIYVDLFNYRELTSTYGHYIGDQLVKNVAERLKRLSETYQIYHLSSTDFGLLAYGSHIGFKPMTERILKLFQMPFYIEAQEIFVEIKMGIAETGFDQSVSALEILRNADTALYQCRKDPSTRFVLYSEDLTATVTSKINLSNLMRQAIDLEEFYVVYQPIVDVVEEKCRLYGFEALIRWNSPQIGMVRPDQFIPIAEETGMIMPLGEFVLNEACRFIKESVIRYPDIVVSVNISAKQMASEQFLNQLFSIVSKYGIGAKNLCLEITESSFIESFENVSAKVEAIRQRGHTIALDDFGTGYSSLNYLGQLNIDTLKIDKTFTGKITDSSSDYYLIKSVIALSKDLKIKFVAEGVETAYQLELLKEIGCPLAQGYYFEKPVSRAEAIAFSCDRMTL